MNDFESWSFFDLLKCWVLFARKQKVNNFEGIGDRTNFCLGAVEFSSSRTRTSTPRRQEQNFHQGTGDRRDCAQESKIWTEASGPETKIYRRAVVRSSTRTRTTRAPPRNPAMCRSIYRYPKNADLRKPSDPKVNAFATCRSRRRFGCEVYSNLYTFEGPFPQPGEWQNVAISKKPHSRDHTLNPLLTVFAQVEIVYFISMTGALHVKK